MFVTKHTVDITTAADGTASGYTPPVNGRILQLQYTKDGTTPYDNTVDVTIIAEDSATPILTVSDVTATTRYVPRQATQSTAGVAALYAAAGTAVNDYVFIAGERVKITLAQGGDTKTGRFIVWVG